MSGPIDHLSAEQEQEILDLAETWGGFEDPSCLASYFGVPKREILRFFKTSRFKEALSRYRPETRAAAVKARLSPTALDSGFPEMTHTVQDFLKKS